MFQLLISSLTRFLGVFFSVLAAMEDCEEHSEAQESDSGFRKASKVEESFRLSHELYLKPASPAIKRERVYFLYGNILQQVMHSFLFHRNI